MENCGSAASLLEAVLLALDHASIARKETGLLEVSTVVASVQERTSDAQAQSAGLTGDAAAIAQSDNVELTGRRHREGSKGVLNELMTAEVLLGVTLVDGHLAGAGDETDAGDGVLTTAGTLVDRCSQPSLSLQLNLRGVLGSMRMLGTSVDLKLGHLGTAEGGLGQHTRTARSMTFSGCFSIAWRKLSALRPPL